jgi:hypothetical protein
MTEIDPYSYTTFHVDELHVGPAKRFACFTNLAGKTFSACQYITEPCRAMRTYPKGLLFDNP